VRTLLRWLGRLAFAGFLGLLFAVSAYLAFSVFVRGGVTSVPEIVGLSVDDARALLADQGLDFVESDQTRFDAAVPAGGVARQEPAAGSLVKRGSPVSVILSSGPHRIAVPTLLGQALPAAQVTLVAAGLAAGRSGGVIRADAPAGTVVEQDPPAGALADASTPVHLLYALEAGSETFVMPDLVYRHYDDVRVFFDARGFRLGSVKFEPYEGVMSGVILRQYPLAGHPLRRREAISLVVTAPADVVPSGR
jgi:serine/threonine-protein kinase